MKIIKENCIYVQKMDVAYLHYYDDEIPLSIYEKTYRNGNYGMTEKNYYEFLKFEEPEEIAFFKSLSWCIDFEEVKDLPDEKIIDLGSQVAEERNKLIAYSITLPLEAKEREKLEFQSELLSLKINTLRDILRWRQGRIKIEFPKEETKNVFTRMLGLLKKQERKDYNITRK